MKARRAFAAALLITLLLASPAALATALGQYYLNGASSGTTPTSATDSGTGTAVSLTITVGTGTWTSRSAGPTNLGFNYAGGSAAISGSLASSKYSSASPTGFSGSTTVSMVALADTTGDPVGATIMSFGSTGIKDMFLMQTVAAANHSGVPAIAISYNDAFVGYCNCTNGLHVIGLVADTSQATAANRILCYIDGSPVTLGTTTYPAQNTTIDNLSTNYANNRICVGCDGSVTVANYVGKIYYGGYWPSVLSSGSMSSISTALLANDDADPTAGGGGTTIYPSTLMGDSSGALTLLGPVMPRWWGSL